jgi:N-acyl-D-aspartate/D-glutamate deacylase
MQPRFDTVIARGRIFDGRGSSSVVANLGLEDEADAVHYATGPSRPAW